MKKYKVSFFAVLMTLSTTVAFGDNTTFFTGQGNSLSNYKEFDELKFKLQLQQMETDTKNIFSKYSTNTNDDGSNNGTADGEVKYNNSNDDKVKDNEDDEVDTSVIEKKRDIAHNILSGASSAMTGIGGMEMAQAISEQKSDADAEEEMGAYLTTFKCDYGKSQKYDYSTQDIILPGGNELVQYYTEYKTLADQLKADKTALGLTPGIESQVVYDKAESGLYKNAATGNTGGKYTSLSRALLDENSEDAAEWAEQKDKTKKRLQIGATVAAAGLVAGFIGDKLIDKHYDKLACGDTAENWNEIMNPLPDCGEYNNKVKKKRTQGRRK